MPRGNSSGTKPGAGHSGKVPGRRPCAMWSLARVPPPGRRQLDRHSGIRQRSLPSSRGKHGMRGYPDERRLQTRTRRRLPVPAGCGRWRRCTATGGGGWRTPHAGHLGDGGRLQRCAGFGHARSRCRNLARCAPSGSARIAARRQRACIPQWRPGSGRHPGTRNRHRAHRRWLRQQRVASRWRPSVQSVFGADLGAASAGVARRRHPGHRQRTGADRRRGATGVAQQCEWRGQPALARRRGQPDRSPGGRARRGRPARWSVPRAPLART